MQTQAEFGDAKKSLIQEKFVHGTEKVPSQYNLFLEVCRNKECDIQL